MDEGTDVAVGGVGSEGERRSSTLSTARDDRPVAPLAPGQRWSLARKREVVGAAADAGRAGRGAVPPAWPAGLQAGRVAATGARRDRRRAARARRRSEGAGARRGAPPHRRVEHGERAVARAAGEAKPFGPQEGALMAAATSPATGQAYGVKRVCTIWGVARSSFYDARRQEGRPPERPAGRRGPKPALSDEDLLAAVDG